MAEADAMPSEPTGPRDWSGARPVSACAGDKLRVFRELAGIDRSEVAARTRINERHLEAIERGNFAALPGRAYAVGFARTYAEAVGLDGAAIAAEVRRELTASDTLASARRSHQLALDDPAKVPSRRVAWVSGALGLAVIAVGTVLWSSLLTPAVELPPVRSQAALAAAAPVLNPGAPAVPTAESAVGRSGATVDAPPPGMSPRQPVAVASAGPARRGDGIAPNPS